MIVLQPDGSGGNSRFIVGGQRLANRVKHDPWHNHSYGAVFFSSFPAASGKWFVVFSATLVDGTDWAYVHPVGFTFDESEFFLAQAATYQVWNYPGNWLGVGFNKIMRPQLTLKLSPTGLSNFLSTH